MSIRVVFSFIEIHRPPSFFSFVFLIFTFFFFFIFFPLLPPVLHVPCVCQLLVFESSRLNFFLFFRFARSLFLLDLTHTQTPTHSHHTQPSDTKRIGLAYFMNRSIASLVLSKNKKRKKERLFVLLVCHLSGILFFLYFLFELCGCARGISTMHPHCIFLLDLVQLSVKEKSLDEMKLHLGIRSRASLRLQNRFQYWNDELDPVTSYAIAISSFWSK